MKNLLKALTLLALLTPIAAHADAYDLTFKPITELTTTTTAPATGDKKIIYEAATGNVKVYSATAEKLTGTFDGIVGGTTPAAGTFTTVSGSTSVASPLINNGSSGAAGTLNIFPSTAANGKLILSAVNNSGAFNSTLTNKILNNPQITGPAPVACGSTCTLGTANLGGYTRLDTAGGSAATLPSATGTGNTYKLYISVATTSAQDKVLLTTVTDTIIGTASGENAGTAKVFVGNAGTYHSIQMPFAGSQPSGGFIGDTITCTDVASTIWKCDIQYQAGTTPTTPYNAGTT